MKNATYRRAAVLALGLAAVMSNASAQLGSASASASNFTYQLFDLDLTDGITPSLSFVDTIESYSYYYSSTLGSSPTDRRTDFGATAAGSGVNAASTLTSATANQSASVSIDKPASGYHGVYASNTELLEFTLSPSTGVRFGWSAQATSTYGVGASAQGRVLLSGEIEVVDNGSWTRDTVFYDELRADNRTVQGTLYGYLESDKVARMGTLRVESWASAGASDIPVVPEPQTYLMLLAGAAVLGGARTLRKPGSLRASA